MAQKRYILLVRMDPPPGKEDEWNHWYDTQHIPARLKFPDFRYARRFVAIEGEPKYTTVYDLTSLDVFTSEEYLKLRDEEASLPPDSFEAITSKLPNFSRCLYEQIYPDEEYKMPDTEIIFAPGIDVPPEKEDSFNAWYNTEHIVAMSRVPGFITRRRFRAVDIELPPRAGSRLSGPKYVALYDLSSADVLQSEAFSKERTSPWTEWVHSWYNRRFRILARRIYPKP